ncbi:11585_t:CDS:2 [Dentiscutata heterogama]|uniref:11585_t:CDS:1 n=1 Tax=Dentiscutata heterogama TaxID=1316150 RepID=A0ACA9N5D1_9GLOM|nr:11585_t:CDS:2 [Dentiscutata heterogama]
MLKIAEHDREKIIANTPQDYANLYTKCWSSDPDQRPTLTQILAVFEKLLAETSTMINQITIINQIIEADDIENNENNEEEYHVNEAQQSLLDTNLKEVKEILHGYTFCGNESEEEETLTLNQGIFRTQPVSQPNFIGPTNLTNLSNRAMNSNRTENSNQDGFTSLFIGSSFQH